MLSRREIGRGRWRRTEKQLGSFFSLEKVPATEEEGEEGNFCAGGEMRFYITRIGSGGVFLGQTERVFHIFFFSPNARYTYSRFLSVFLDPTPFARLEIVFFPSNSFSYKAVNFFPRGSAPSFFLPSTPSTPFCSVGRKGKEARDNSSLRAAKLRPSPPPQEDKGGFFRPCSIPGEKEFPRPSFFVLLVLYYTTILRYRRAEAAPHGDDLSSGLLPPT